jgi:hypothetical protein
MTKPTGRPPIFFRAMTDAERQAKRRARNAIGKDWQWLRSSDPEFIGKRLAVAVWDFAKGTDSGRWAEIDFYARQFLADLEQENTSFRDRKPRRFRIRDYLSIFD